ncbi:hypothetical protein D3C85_1771870 [compost metagenome]
MCLLIATAAVAQEVLIVFVGFFSCPEVILANQYRTFGNRLVALVDVRLEVRNIAVIQAIGVVNQLD